MVWEDGEVLTLTSYPILPQEDRTHKHVLENARQTAIRTHLGGRDLWKELSSFKLPNGQSALWQPTNTKPPKNRAPVQANAGPPVTQTLPECPKVNAILTVPEQFVKTVRGSSQEQKFNGSSASGETAGKEQQKKNFDTQDQKSKKDDAKKQRAEALKAKRKQKARNVAFDRAFNAAVDEIFREKQTRRRLTWVALKLVIKYDADPETLERVLANRTPGAEQGFFHIERPRIFPKSPISPIKWWRVPKVVAGDKPRRWSNIRWKKELVIGELRVQSRRLFPKAPKWSPLHKLEIPALRFTLKKSKWKPLERRQKTSRQDARVAKQSSRDQSQSQ